jgi:hypothetical protein
VLGERSGASAPGRGALVQKLRRLVVSQQELLSHRSAWLIDVASTAGSARRVGAALLGCGIDLVLRDVGCCS